MWLVRFKDQGMSSPYLERRDMLRGDLRENRDMMHYPGGSSAVRRLSINDVNRKPWYDESRHPTDPQGSSAAERVSAMNAARGVERTQPMFDNRPVNEDVYFDLIEQEKIAWGQPFNIQVLIQVFFLIVPWNSRFLLGFIQKIVVGVTFQNRSQEMRTITTILSANSVYYTGVTARRLGRSDRQFVLQPGGRTSPYILVVIIRLHYSRLFWLIWRCHLNIIGETLQVRISWDEYRDKIVDYGHIKIFAMASVQETKQSWSEEDDFQLEKPKLDVQVCQSINFQHLPSQKHLYTVAYFMM